MPKISALPVGTATSSTPFPAIVGGVTDQVTLEPVYTSLAGKAATSHTHAESDVTNLVTDLAAKATISTLTPTLTPLDQSSWTWVNQGAAVVTQSSTLVRLMAPTSATENVRARVVAVPATPYSVTAVVYPGPLRTGATTQIGLCFYDSAGGKIVAFGFNSNVASATNTINVGKYTNVTTLASNITLGSLSSIAEYWLRITDDGILHVYQVSFDKGINYETVLSEARATFFSTAAPNRYGIAVYNFGGVISCGGSFASLVTS